MTHPRTRTVVLITALITAAVAIPAGWYEIDRTPPLVYQEAWYEALPAERQKIGGRIDAARAGDTVVLALKIKWPRLNCSTELERRFVGSDGALYKVPLAAGEPTRLGPPPANLLAPDQTFVSRRRVLLPIELPAGVAHHSPNAWERCTSPALTWGDYLTDIWPIFVGPKGAEAKIAIQR